MIAVILLSRVNGFSKLQCTMWPDRWSSKLSFALTSKLRHSNLSSTSLVSIPQHGSHPMPFSDLSQLNPVSILQCQFSCGPMRRVPVQVRRLWAINFKWQCGFGNFLESLHTMIPVALTHRKQESLQTKMEMREPARGKGLAEGFESQTSGDKPPPTLLFVSAPEVNLKPIRA